MSLNDALIIVFAACLVAYLLTNRSSKRSSLHLPPGPKGLPLIGSLRDMPKSFEWVTYHEWCKDFNTDILHINVAGTTFIILDTAEAAIDLLEKRSSLYSDRARMPMVNELMGWTFNIALMEYGDTWRKHRRLMHHSFHPTASRQYHPHELKATRNLLNRLLEYPDDLVGNLRQMAGETIMSIAYGIDIQSKNDPYVTTAESGAQGLFKAAIPGAFLVDSFPILKYLPEWMPGGGFQKKAREWKVFARRIVEAPFAAVKRDMARGTFRTSFTSASLQKMDEGTKDEAYQEEVIQNTAGTMYTAGSDTTVSAILSCILGIIENPEVLKNAQHELDHVLRPGHLPDFDDKPSLPYVTAVVMETLRWGVVTPIAVPRLLKVEDEYNSYQFPKGSIVIPNAWAMLHNDDVYPDPFTFNPSRFIKDGKLDKSVRDPEHACWGFGRRTCPGRYMAFSAIWLAVASMIAVFDIKKAVDENGNVIEPTHEYTPGIVCHPKPFKCQITPRSKEVETLVRTPLQQDI